jgi:cytochrome c oxidase subunit 2
MLVVSAVCVTGVCVAGDAARGKTLYAACAACHGADGSGNQQLYTPRIAGQHAWFLKRQLENFKKGLRGYDDAYTHGVLMRNVAKAMSDADIADVVAYIGTMAPPAVSPATLEGDLKAGATLFKKCQICHGKDGSGKKMMKTPDLRKQHDWYLLLQMENYRKDYRGTHPKDNAGGRMWAIARSMGDEKAIRDVIAYIRSLE